MGDYVTVRGLRAVIWERPELVNELILGFLAGGEPQTSMPIRRGATGGLRP